MLATLSGFNCVADVLDLEIDATLARQLDRESGPDESAGSGWAGGDVGLLESAAIVDQQNGVRRVVGEDAIGDRDVEKDVEIADDRGVGLSVKAVEADVTRAFGDAFGANQRRVSGSLAGEDRTLLSEERRGTQKEPENYEEAHRGHHLASEYSHLYDKVHEGKSLIVL